MLRLLGLLLLHLRRMLRLLGLLLWRLVASRVLLGGMAAGRLWGRWCHLGSLFFVSMVVLLGLPNELCNPEPVRNSNLVRHHNPESNRTAVVPFRLKESVVLVRRMRVRHTEEMMCMETVRMMWPVQVRMVGCPGLLVLQTAEVGMAAPDMMVVVGANACIFEHHDVCQEYNHNLEAQHDQKEDQMELVRDLPPGCAMSIIFVLGYERVWGRGQSNYSVVGIDSIHDLGGFGVHHQLVCALRAHSCRCHW